MNKNNNNHNNNNNNNNNNKVTTCLCTPFSPTTGCTNTWLQEG